MGVIFGDNQFVVVGGNGVILTGSNGINWSSRTSSINVDLLDAAYGNGVYVVVGNSGKILTSMDFVTWTSRSSGVRGNLFGVVFGNSRFVVVGVGEIVYSMCDQPAAAADVLNNQKFLQGPGESRKAQSAGRKANFLSDMGLLSPRSYLGPMP